MATLEELVADVVEDTVEWPTGSFAVFASAAEPSWYVQFAVEDIGDLVVELASQIQATSAAPHTPRTNCT